MADFSLKDRLPNCPGSIDSAGVAGRLELVVVMPAYNEGANLAAVVREWVAEFRARGIRFAFLVIDDGSRDQTPEVLRALEGELPEVVGWSKRNDGHGVTCRKGYEQALETGVEWVFQIDSDGQSDPKFFAEVWNARHEVDLVFGERVSRDDGFARTLTSQACRWGTFLWTGAFLRDPNVPYRLMRAPVLARAMERVPPDFNIYNVALSLAFSREPGVRWKHLPIHFPKRAGGVNSLNVRGVMRMGWQMLMELKRIR